MLSVGLESQLHEYLSDGYLLVGTRIAFAQGGEQYTRYELVAPWRTCCKPLYVSEKHPSLNTYCLMDKDHRGRHTSQVFSCDSCSKTRRGQPYRQDETVAICFMCVRGLVRYEGHDGKRQKSIFCN